MLNTSHFTEHGKILPSLGIGVYEPFLLGIYYDAYTGVGISPRFNADNVSWFVSRHDIGTYLGDFNFSVGATVKISAQRSLAPEDESNLHLKVTYELW